MFGRFLLLINTLKQRVEFLFQLAFGNCSHVPVYYFAVFEKQEVRYVPYVELHCELLIFIGVYLSYKHFAVVLFRHTVEYWNHAPAGTAPFCPKVNEGNGGCLGLFCKIVC